MTKWTKAKSLLNKFVSFYIKRLFVNIDAFRLFNQIIN